MQNASGHSHSLLTSFRTCSTWLNRSSSDTHMLIRYGPMTPRGVHMRRLATALRAPLLLPKVVCNVHVALSNLTQHLFCIDIWWTSSPEYEVPVFNAQTHNHGRKWKAVRVSRRMDCPGWIADLVWLNLMLAPIIKFICSMAHVSCI